jgi:hypothetical protein
MVGIPAHLFAWHVETKEEGTVSVCPTLQAPLCPTPQSPLGPTLIYTALQKAILMSVCTAKPYTALH